MGVTAAKMVAVFWAEERNGVWIGVGVVFVCRQGGWVS